MTEDEKLFLNENARIYHASGTVPPAKGGMHGAFPCIIAAVLALSGVLCLDGGADMLERAARISAGAELMSFDGSFVNETPENADNILESTPQPTAEDELLMLSSGTGRMPSSADEYGIAENFLPEPAPANDDADNPLPYTVQAEETQSGVISELTYTAGKGENYIDLPMGGQIRNVTELSADEIARSAAMSPDFGIKLNAPEDEPQVLIMHTHTTESYEPYRRSYYDASFTSRTTDMSKNVAAVGDVMTRVLEENGIRTYHDTTVHDYPSYNGAYDRSRVTVEEILEKYPSIKVVLDIHRDAIERESGERIAPTVTINGKSSAQVMIICGCDDGTMGMPDCMKNLRTAALFEQYMESSFNGLTRPMLYDYRKYNQDLTTGSLLIEVGGHANSLDQALYAGELTAQAISKALLSLAG